MIPEDDFQKILQKEGVQANDKYICELINYQDSPFFQDGTIDQLNQIIQKIGKRKQKTSNQQHIIDALNKQIEKMKGSEVVERMSFQQFRSVYNYILNYNSIPKLLKETEIKRPGASGLTAIHEEQLRYFYAAALEFGNIQTAKYIENKYMSSEEGLQPKASAGDITNFTITKDTVKEILQNITNVEKMPLNLIKFYYQNLDEIIWSYQNLNEGKKDVNSWKYIKGQYTDKPAFHINLNQLDFSPENLCFDEYVVSHQQEFINLYHLLNKVLYNKLFEKGALNQKWFTRVKAPKCVSLNYHLDINDLIKAHNEAFKDNIKVEWPEGRIFRI